MKKLLLIFHTIRHLRPIQIRFQIWYRLRKFCHKKTGFRYPLLLEKQGNPLTFKQWIEKPSSYYGQTFTYLHVTCKYPGNKINWNENRYGRLWAYNLNYMDYLLQPGMDKETGYRLIAQFINDADSNETGLEAYPLALRGMNWIKFMAKHRTNTIDTRKKDPCDQKIIDSSLYAQYNILFKNIEYHLLGNHLLEDGFSLFFGSFYFREEKFFNKARNILQKELNEQILNDGAHFELSPMYHQIILDRLLDCINLLENNTHFPEQENLLVLMKEKAVKMLSWLKKITFSNGQIPLLNDAAPAIAPETKELMLYASRLNLSSESSGIILSDSGYRRFDGKHYECIIDIGQIGPSYQPGHAHADTFNFVINIRNEPYLVDTGISTYETGEDRLKERGTAAHNTVTVNELNSSEVWSSFRVARRARVKILHDTEEQVIAQHDGYRLLNTIHSREWRFSENNIRITDTLTGKIKKGKAHLWLSPHITPKQKGKTIELKNANITFANGKNVRVIKTRIPAGFNRFAENSKIEISFDRQLETIISVM